MKQKLIAGPFKCVIMVERSLNSTFVKTIFNSYEVQLAIQTNTLLVLDELVRPGWLEIGLVPNNSIIFDSVGIYNNELCICYKSNDLWNFSRGFGLKPL